MSTHSRSDHTASAVLIAILVTVLWSSSWVLIRWGLDGEDLPPLTFAALRYGTAAVLLAIPVAVRPNLRVTLQVMDRRQWRDVLVLGVVFYGVNQAAQFIAIDSQPAATTSMILSLTPLLVAAWGMRLLGEHPTRGQWVGAALVAVGAAAFFAGQLGATVVGMIAALVNLGTNSGAAVLGRRINREKALSPLVVTATGMAVGAAALVVAGLAVDGVPSVTPRGWLIIGWLAAVNTALAFTLWNRAQRELSALQTAGINNTMLIQIAVLAWVFLSEAPGVLGIVGIALVSTGVYLTQRTSAAVRGGDRRARHA